MWYHAINETCDIMVSMRHVISWFQLDMWYHGNNDTCDIVVSM